MAIASQTKGPKNLKQTKTEKRKKEKIGNTQTWQLALEFETMMVAGWTLDTPV